jgi:excisionase family DNA binding protein
MTKQILTVYSEEDIIVLQKKATKEVLDEFFAMQQMYLPKNERKSPYASRHELSKALTISLPTLHTLTNNGTLKGYRIGGRILYKWDEVDAALVEIQSNKYKSKRRS